MATNCMECGEKLMGRADKKFCSDYCRNAYHNAQNRVTHNLIRNINHRLKKNYNILSKINTSGKTKTHKEQLDSRGFDFEYFTHLYTTRSGTVYYFVYDQGYLPLDNGFYMLVKREN